MKKTSLLVVLVVVLALAAMGVAYGMWSETLNISGTVNTGTVNAEFSVGTISDNEIEGKDTAWCTSSLSNDGNTFYVTMNNGYPLYECYVTFDVHNVGSIPIHIHQPTFTGVPGELVVNFVDCYDQDTQLHTSQAAYCTLKVKVLQSASQGSTYNFSGTVFAHQYNEE
jgi:hypothetical protein